MKLFYTCILCICSFFIYTETRAKDILVVSIAPQAYFLKHIVGNTQDVITFLPRGADPHTFEPSIKILQKVSKARVFFTIGIGLENQWEHRLHAIAPSVEFVPSYIEQVMTPDIHSHQHSHEGHEHSHHSHDTHDGHNHSSCTPSFKKHSSGALIPINQHVWTSPRSMQIVIEQMMIKLIELYPQYTEMYTKNASELMDKMVVLNEEIQTGLQNKKHRIFISYHPSWGYFANEYDLQELVIEENEREPSAKTMVQLIKTAKEKQARVILTQPQFPQKSVQTLSKELNTLPIVNIDPLQEDWFSMMREMKETLEKYLQ